MAAGLGRIDVAALVESGPAAARQEFEKGQAIVKVYALPRAELKIRAKKRIIRLDEGKLARLEYALVVSAARAAGEGRKPRFREFAELVGDWKAAAAYLAFLWRQGLVVFAQPEAPVNLYVAASSLSQKTYEHRISKVLDAEFGVDSGKLRELPSDEVLCVQQNGLVACRYVTSNTSRSQAKAQVRAAITLAGMKPA